MFHLRFEGKSIYTGVDEGEEETEGDLIGYIINLKEGVGRWSNDFPWKSVKRTKKNLGYISLFEYVKNVFNSVTIHSTFNRQFTF